MDKLFLFSLISFFFSPSLFSQSTRWHVSKTAVGANSGLNWADAFTDLQSACAAAAAGDVIWVVSGEYLPDTGTNRDKHFALKSGVKIYGGFSGGENSLGQRNLLANHVVLSGNIGNPLDSTDNAYTILHLAYPDTSTLVDGLTFQHGYAVSDTSFFNNSPALSGGAVYIESKNGKALPVFKNCNFLDNVAKSKGGAIFINGQGSTDCMPLFYNCNFINNRSLFQGGAVFMTGGIKVDRGDEFRDCRFERNSASYQAGGIYYANSYGTGTLNFQHCVITQNTAYHYGGFMYMPRFGTFPLKITIDSTEISKNYSETRQSVLYVEDNIFQAYQTVIKITNSIVSNNAQGYSNTGDLGNITIEASVYGPPFLDTLIISHSQIINNLTGHGPILQITCRGFARVIKNLIFNNSNTSSQGNFFGGYAAIGTYGNNVEISGNIAANNRMCPLGGSVIASPGSKLLIYNNLIYKNIVIGSTYGNQVLSLGMSTQMGFRDTAQVFNNVFINNKVIVSSNSSHFSGQPIASLRNNIFVNNTDAASGERIIPFRLNWDSLYLAHNLLDLDCSALPVPVFCGAGNIYAADALFVDTAAHNFRLKPCSPAVNAGDNTMLLSNGIYQDFDGEPRILESTVDIGAYESPAFALATTPDILPACTGAPGGAITISPANGCEPYTYQWMPAAGNGPEITGLPPGSYSYTVTDARGRMLFDTLSIVTAASPQISPLTQNIQCGSPLGGSATVSVSNGTAPYSFLWENAAIDSLRTMLPVGEYQVTVTDQNGCRDSVQMNITKQGNITLMVDGQPISCFGQIDASISAAPVNGKAPYQYLWSPTGSSDSLLTGLGPGMYTVTATDFYGCTASFTFNLSDPPLLQATMLTMPCSSLQSPNGIATANPNGGIPSYTYAWSNLGSTMTIGGLPPGTYTVTITDAHGCSATATAEVKLLSNTAELEDINVQVWPNPMREQLELRAAGLPGGEYRFALQDALGREVDSTAVQGERAVLDVRDLAPGVYSWSLKGWNGRLASGIALK